MGPALIVGSSRSVWSDLHALGADRPGVVFAINDMIVLAPDVHHAVSHHADKLVHWNALRTHAGPGRPREAEIVTHSSVAAPGIDRSIELADPRRCSRSGSRSSSAMLR
jgi:hypothetical protein